MQPDLALVVNKVIKHKCIHKKNKINPRFPAANIQMKKQFCIVLHVKHPVFALSVS